MQRGMYRVWKKSEGTGRYAIVGRHETYALGLRGVERCDQRGWEWKFTRRSRGVEEVIARSGSAHSGKEWLERNLELLLSTTR